MNDFSNKMRRSRLLRFFAWTLVTGLSFAILGAIAALLVYQHYARDLPDYSQLAKYEPPIVTRLYAADGKFMAEYATENRIYVPLSAIPRRVIQAFLSAEDRNFYQHAGVDIYGVARAIRENILNIGQHEALVGGSTITQQVVKNFLLTNEQSLERKVKEAILAFRITEAYSKDRILELYLNQIFLGHRSYGVAAAALSYFNTPLNELSIEQAALLAAMPKAPSTTSPTRNYKYAKARRDWVIGRMQQDGFITSEEAEGAQKTPIILNDGAGGDTVKADFFAEEVRRSLSALYGRNVLYEGGLSVRTTLDPVLQNYADNALRAALIAYDRRHGWHGVLGHIATEEWKAAFKTWQESKGREVPLLESQETALVLKLTADAAQIGLGDGEMASIPLAEMKWARRRLDTETVGAQVKKAADVLAVGDIVLVSPTVKEGKKEDAKEAKDTKEETKETKKPARDLWKLEQVPQVNGAMVVMEPHTGKVLAMTGGYSGLSTDFNRATQAKRQPGSAIKPFVYLTALENGYTPTSIIVDGPVEMSQGAGMPNWKPQNYHDDYLGPSTLRTGVEKSRNAMTVRLAQALGIDPILKTCERFGIYDSAPRNFSIVLGAAETTLLRLSNAYATIDNGGFKLVPTMIERINDRNGKTIFRRDARECPGCIASAGQDITENTPPIPPDTRERILDPRVAYQVTSILEGVVQRGTAVRAKSIGKPVGGKTGTTNDSRDTWFMGFSPDLVVGTYIGFDTPKPMGKKETGASVALPAFISFMTDALKDVPAKAFTVPPGIQIVAVDKHSGQPVATDSGASVIQEAFLVGEPPFVPGRDPAQAPAQAPAPIVEDPSQIKEDLSDRPWLIPQGAKAPPPAQTLQPPPGLVPVRPDTNIPFQPDPRYQSRYPVEDPRYPPQAPRYPNPPLYQNAPPDARWQRQPLPPSENIPNAGYQQRRTVYPPQDRRDYPPQNPRGYNDPRDYPPERQPMRGTGGLY